MYGVKGCATCTRSPRIATRLASVEYARFGSNLGCFVPVLSIGGEHTMGYHDLFIAPNIELMTTSADGNKSTLLSSFTDLGDTFRDPLPSAIIGYNEKLYRN